MHKHIKGYPARLREYNLYPSPCLGTTTLKELGRLPLAQGERRCPVCGALIREEAKG
jgi:hypothetical protein